MTRMQIIMSDGDKAETVFDEVIEGWMAPPKPDMIPQAIRAQLNPNAKPAPFLKAMMVAMLAKGIESMLSDPRLQPLERHVVTRPTGWTISVDIPPPSLPAGQADVQAGPADAQREP